MGADLHGLNGVCPEVGKHLLNLYVMPRLTYGLEALKLLQSDLTDLDEFHRRNLRAIQHLPRSTGKPAI
jgi:hypothetical protein